VASCTLPAPDHERMVRDVLARSCPAPPCRSRATCPPRCGNTSASTPPAPTPTSSR
jgi:hypothetical protein